ncbi:MAG: ABC transporter ATP-binding protein [Chlamydiota bacterium]|nr:ABC transporter ATP-binding protein [Chlamydiota bacterium]
MIEIIGLEKSFGDVCAVQDLNLSINKGVFYVLLGPNSAGKTTTIKILTGLLAPSKGRVIVAGMDIQKEPLAVKKKVSYIPDFPFVYDKLTGLEFLQFIADIHDLAQEKAKLKIDELLDYFELTLVQHKLLESYSHGMKQRLVFCAAILTGPEVFLIDEPMVGLDPRSARLVKDKLKRMSTDGTTLFVSTHTLSFAEELADRIGIIYKGKLLIDASPSEIMKYAKDGSGGMEQAFLDLTREM